MRWTDDEREAFLVYFAELWPRVEGWSGRRTILYVEACENRETPCWAAKEALKDLRLSWETETPPNASLVAQKANDNYRREAATRVPQQYADKDPDCPAQVVAALDDWWKPRLNHPNKVLRAKYQSYYQTIKAGEVPTVFREPGED